MRTSHKMGIYANNFPPTLAEAFSTLRGYVLHGRNSSSTGSPGINFSNYLGTYYVFYCCGSSLEISRIISSDNGSVSKTQLSLTAASDSYKKSTTLSGTTLSSVSTYSCTLLAMKFSDFYPQSTLDYVFSNCWKSRIKYKEPTSSTATAANIRATDADITATNSKGILLATFYYSSNANWSITKTNSPLTLLQMNSSNASATSACQGSSWLTRPVIFLNSNNYYLPTANGTSACTTSLYGYSLFKLYEDW